MSLNPYQNLPPESFWSSAVAKSESLVPSNLYKKKWSINKTDNIATAGSCFAQHIGRNLKNNDFHVMDMEPPPVGLTPEEEKQFGYSIYTARYGNIYTTRQLLQLAREAFDEWKPGETVWQGKNGAYYDAFRPGVEPEGLDSAQEVLAHRSYHLQQVRKMFEEMDLFIFTMGLTEAWVHTQSGTVYPTAPGTIAGTYNPQHYHFKNFMFDEIRADFNAFKKLIHVKQNKGKKTKFLLTVSPVPLTATASNKHVMLATTYSKATLRAVAGQLSNHQQDIDYFPSFEIISNPWSDTQFYKSNRRSVKDQGVETVMLTFFNEHLDLVNDIEPPIPGITSSNNRESFDLEKSSEDVICEEEILEAFNKAK